MVSTGGDRAEAFVLPALAREGIKAAFRRLAFLNLILAGLLVLRNIRGY